MSPYLSARMFVPFNHGTVLDQNIEDRSLKFRNLIVLILSKMCPSLLQILLSQCSVALFMPSHLFAYQVLFAGPPSKAHGAYWYFGASRHLLFIFCYCEWFSFEVGSLPRAPIARDLHPELYFPETDCSRVVLSKSPFPASVGLSLNDLGQAWKADCRVPLFVITCF